MSKSELTHDDYLSRIEQTAALHQQAGKDLRVVGSWGIALAANEPLPNPKGDYGPHRDTDIVVFPSTHEPLFREAKQIFSPITLEVHFKDAISFSSDSAEAAIYYQDTSIPVDPRIFAQNIVIRNGFTVPTMDIKTLLHLPFLYGPRRQKDKMTWEKLFPLAQELSSLGDDLFEPFYELAQKRKQHYPHEERMAELRLLYQSIIPLPLRRRVAFITVPLWRRTTKLK